MVDRRGLCGGGFGLRQRGSRRSDFARAEGRATAGLGWLCLELARLMAKQIAYDDERKQPSSTLIMVEYAHY
jgi:hypothetical protein